MRTALLILLALAAGAAVGAVGASLALRDDAAALVRPAVDPAAVRLVRSVETAAHLAKVENPGDAAAELRQLADSLGRLARGGGADALTAATREWAAALARLADEADRAQAATSGVRGAARGTWQALRGLAGDEPGGPPNAADLRAATADVAAAAATFARAAEDAGAPPADDDLPGLRDD